jgi:hypothetical protein
LPSTIGVGIRSAVAVAIRISGSGTAAGSIIAACITGFVAVGTGVDG